MFLVKVTEWPLIGKIAAHSAYEMFLWYKCLVVCLVFSHLGFWSGNRSLIAPFPDLCLLVPYSEKMSLVHAKFSSCKSYCMRQFISRTQKSNTAFIVKCE